MNDINGSPIFVEIDKFYFFFVAVNELMNLSFKIKKKREVKLRVRKKKFQIMKKFKLILKEYLFDRKKIKFSFENASVKF